jgi:hypothetical protein
MRLDSVLPIGDSPKFDLYVLDAYSFNGQTTNKISVSITDHTVQLKVTLVCIYMYSGTISCSMLYKFAKLIYYYVLGVV